MAQRSQQRTLPGVEPVPSVPAAPILEPPPEVPETPAADPEAPPEDDLREAKCETPDLAGKTVWLIDANSLIYQVFHAIGEMTSPRGEPVNAVFGFMRDLLYILQEKRPDYLFCAYDLPGKTFRHELYDDYKAHRAEMPDELIPQIPHIRRMVEALGIATLEQEGYEADDLLATVARKTELAGGQCYVVTTDKDCRQLISDSVRLFNVRKNQVLDAEALLADWGIRPDQVVDFQALVGDPVDHVPGVPLIGPKLAGDLLSRFGTLEGLYERLDEVSGTKRKQNLQTHREQVMLSRQLVRLETEVDTCIDWDAARVGRLDPTPALALCAEFGFHRFAEQLRQLKGAEQGPVWQASYRTISTLDELHEVVRHLRQAGLFSFDTETTSLRPAEAEVVGYALAWAPGEACYVPVRAPAGEPCLDPDQVLEILRAVLVDPSIKKVGQNLKYDMVVLRTLGVELAGVEFDTMVASYLLDAGERNHNLDELAQRYLNHTTIKISQLIGTGKQQRRMDEVAVDQVTQYAAEDADVPLRLVPLLKPQLAAAELSELFANVEIPLVEVLAELEYRGIRVDPEPLRRLSQEYGRRMAEIEQEIHAIAGHPFNIASPKQVGQVLFEELKLPVIKRTQTGPSTDADVLQELASLHELPAKIVEYRQYAKLKGTYVDAIPELINPRTGRVHASFHQAIAATGRLSSSDPNLQNIPTRTELGHEIRAAFLPGPEGWTLLAADYSQIELRVLAHFSGDETLRAAFARDEDIHTLVASQVFGVPQDEVTSAMRRSAKAVNFGVIYGQSAFGLAKSLSIPQDQAAQFIEAYFARYPGVERFMTEVLAGCLEKGYVSTILGRRRAIRGVRPLEVTANKGRQRNLPERTAINTVIQGSAADLIKLAMVAIHRRLKQEQRASRMLLQIHDELIFEVPPEELDSMIELVRQEMSQAWPLEVPLKVDVKTGPNWAETERR